MSVHVSASLSGCVLWSRSAGDNEYAATPITHGKSRRHSSTGAYCRTNSTMIPMYMTKLKRSADAGLKPTEYIHNLSELTNVAEAIASGSRITPDAAMP